MARFGSFTSLIAVAGLVGALAVGPAIVASAAGEDPIAERKENRKAVRDQFALIKAVVDKSGPAADVVAPSRKIVELEAAFVKLFPAGSDKGDTKALPIIWTDFKGFEAAGAGLSTQATKMADLGAGGKSADEIKAQYAEMGKACGTCHNTYRAK
jgi:cytochrome c556